MQSDGLHPLKPIELVDPEGSLLAEGSPDRRPILPVPPPVRLIAVDDVILFASAGDEAALDRFYVGLLHFEREDQPLPPPRIVEPLPGVELPRVGTTRLYPPLPPLVAGAIQGPVYRAERFRISLQVKETPWEHDGLRPLGIEVPSLALLEAQLIEREIKYVRQKSITPGNDSFLAQDPSGNWVVLMAMQTL